MDVSALHPWIFGWDALVAIGTLTLAAVTVGLGFVAVRGNCYAREALAISQAELRASMFPLIEAVPVQVDSDRDTEPLWPIDYTSVGGNGVPEQLAWEDEVNVYGESSGVYVSVPIQNRGHGVARLGPSKPRALSVPDVLWTEGDATRPLIPAGEDARLNFRLNGVRQEIYAEVFYSDISGNQEACTRLYLRRETDESGKSSYPVRGTAMYQSDQQLVAVVGDPKVTVEQPSTRV